MSAYLETQGFQVDRCDIVNGDNCLNLFRTSENTYDLTVHAAAVAPHRAAIDGVPQNLMHNVLLDSSFFKWALRTGQHKVVYLSSSAAYPVDLQDSVESGMRLFEDMIDLDRPGTPDAAYGWTKVTGEKMALAARSAGLDVAVVRPFSGYGEDQGEDWPFGAFVARAVRREDPFDIWGPGTQMRDWIHIDDIVAAILAISESGTPEPVNLCTGRGTAMSDVAWRVCATVGYWPEPRHHLDRPVGVMHRVGDPHRLSQFYTPRVTLEEGVQRAVKALLGA